MVINNGLTMVWQWFDNGLTWFNMVYGKYNCSCLTWSRTSPKTWHFFGTRFFDVVTASPGQSRRLCKNWISTTAPHDGFTTHMIRREISHRSISPKCQVSLKGIKCDFFWAPQNGSFGVAPRNYPPFFVVAVLFHQHHVQGQILNMRQSRYAFCNIYIYIWYYTYIYIICRIVFDGLSSLWKKTHAIFSGIAHLRIASEIGDQWFVHCLVLSHNYQV